MADFLRFVVCRIYVCMDYVSYKNIQEFMDAEIDRKTQFHILPGTRYVYNAHN